MTCEQVQRVAAEPGAGAVGAAVIDSAAADGRELKNLMVFNAEELEISEEFAQAKIEAIRLHETR